MKENTGISEFFDGTEIELLIRALREIREIVPEKPKLPICHQINDVLDSVKHLIKTN